MRTLLLLTLLTLAPAGAGERELDAFSYRSTEEAREHWQPQYGSKPVRVESLEDGSTCLALDAEFAKVKDRACWDWTAWASERPVLLSSSPPSLST